MSEVVDKGNVVVFNGSGSFVLLGQCAVASARKTVAGGFKDASRCMRSFADGFPSAESPLVGPSTRLSKPGPPVRPLEDKALGTVGELSTLNRGAEVLEVALE